MLRHVAGTGQAGDVVLVTPAFYNNKLRPTQAAQIISDEQVQQEQAAAAAEAQEQLQTATTLQERLQALTLTLERKAGPDGQLFGGVGPKVIMEELKQVVVEDAHFLDSKTVKITALLDHNGKKMRGDIKHVGRFAANVALAKDISAKFTIDVKQAS